MSGGKTSAVVIVALMVLMSSVDVSRCQETGIVRFTNMSNNTVVTIQDLSTQKTSPELGFTSFVEFNQSIDSTSVSLFQITNSKTRSVIANLVVPSATNVTFLDVANFADVVIAVGTFPTS